MGFLRSLTRLGMLFLCVAPSLQGAETGVGMGATLTPEQERTIRVMKESEQAISARLVNQFHRRLLDKWLPSRRQDRDLEIVYEGIVQTKSFKPLQMDGVLVTQRSIVEGWYGSPLSWTIQDAAEVLAQVWISTKRTSETVGSVIIDGKLLLVNVSHTKDDLGVDHKFVEFGDISLKQMVSQLSKEE